MLKRRLHLKARHPKQTGRQIAAPPLSQALRLSVERHGLVFRHKRLHAEPTDDVSNRAVAEHHHIAGGLARVAEERKRLALLFSEREELTGALVDHEAAATSRKLSNTSERCNRGLREHIADDGIHVGAPCLMTRASKTDEDSRPPCAECAERLCRKGEKREARKDEHGHHTTFIGVHATLIHEERRKLAEVNRNERNDCVERDDESHAHSRVAAIAELVGEVARSPEKEEPPHTIGEEAAEDERPGMTELERLEIGNLRAFSVRGSGLGVSFGIGVGIDVFELGGVHAGVLGRLLVEPHPESHPKEAEGTDDDEGHFPAPELRDERNRGGGGKRADRGTGVEDRR